MLSNAFNLPMPWSISRVRPSQTRKLSSAKLAAVESLPGANILANINTAKVVTTNTVLIFASPPTAMLVVQY
jgi:hypothetical protein